MLNTLEMRKDLLRMGLASKSAGAHLGGSLSLVEIMAALYGGVMNFNVDDPKRDRLERTSDSVKELFPSGYSYKRSNL